MFEFFSNYPIGSTLFVFFFVFVPALLYFLTLDSRPNLPPQFKFLGGLFTGAFNFKTTGPLTLIRKGYQKHGDCYRLRILHRNVYVLVGPEAHAAFMAPNDHIVSAADVYRFTVPVFGEKVVYDAPLHRMQQQLKFVSQGLTGPALNTHAPKIRAEVEDFFGKLPQSGELDMFETFAELVINTATRCLLGLRFRLKLGREVAHLYQELSDGMNHLSVFWPYAPTAKHRARDAARVKMVKMFNDVLAERRASKKRIDDYLQLLIESQYNEEPRKITDHEIHGLLLGTLFAGQHTSSITSTWLGGLLLKNPKYWPLLVEEQERVMARHNGQITLDSLHDMELLGACIKETLRHFPPLVALARKLKEDQTYKRKDGTSYKLYKDDIMVVCPPVAHKLEHIYKNPEEFYPERFLGDNPEAQEKYAYIAFGGGRHGCLGERFAFVQIKTIWSIVLRNFTFELVKDSLPPVNYDDIVAGPRPPLMVRYKRLEKPIGLVVAQIPSDANDAKDD